MLPKLVACDLDGTLLTDDKKLSPANRAALIDMATQGAVIVLASGRLGSSMMQYADQLPVPCAMVTLNGADVYRGKVGQSERIYSASLPTEFARKLITFSREKGNADMAMNYYLNNILYTEEFNRNNRWIDLYFDQTRTRFEFVPSLEIFNDKQPHKILLVGDPGVLDRHEKAFQAQWGSAVYIVRTWDYYLEFLNMQAHKGAGIAALLDALHISKQDAIAFGDADNDAPLLQACGRGIALKNSTPKCIAAANTLLPWSNNEDAIAREWERIKQQ